MNSLLYYILPVFRLFWDLQTQQAEHILPSAGENSTVCSQGPEEMNNIAALM